jgi:thioredoxin reductase (NADPH)
MFQVMPEDLYDVIIIGGGPAGLSAAQYTARAGLKTIVLDRSPAAGALAYTGKIENYPGLKEPVSGKELLEIFREQATTFGAEYVIMQVTGVKFSSDIKEVQAMEQVFRGKTVIVATGSMGRKPSIPGEEKFLGRGVSYCAVCDASFYKDLTVCVLGDSEEAVKEAGFLTRFAKTVYLFSPSGKLKVENDHPALVSEKLQVLLNHRVTSIEGDDLVTKVRVKDTDSGREREMPMDGVFVYLYGTQPVIDFLDAEIPISEQMCITTHRSMETSISGVFAAGDVSCAEVRQVVTAAAFGCIAALSAEKFIYLRSRMKYDWSKS